LGLISVPGVICLWPHCRHFYNAKVWPWLIKMPTQVATLRWSLWDFVFGKKTAFQLTKPQITYLPLLSRPWLQRKRANLLLFVGWNLVLLSVTWIS